MRQLSLLIFSLGLLISGQGQSPPGALIKEPKGTNENCIHKDKYSVSERLRFYPFNVADTIMLVSFRYHHNNYPVRKDYITTDSLIEQRVLSKTEVNQLTDIIYNTDAKKHGNIASVAECFEPRNAVLFIDKAGKLRAYMLICFHCRRYEPSSEDIGSWDNCNQKPEMIRRFFTSAGIKFGTDLAINGYPGE